jgi:release factor glutamine methyltransferase
MNCQEILNEGSKILKLNNIKSFNLDSEILLSSVLKLERSKLILNLNKNVKYKDKKNYFNLIERRKKNEPVAYITGYKEFWKDIFKVNRNVLIPRPDTEIVVEQILNELDVNSSKRILDIGTGSGCIILSILKERKKCHGTGIDISKKAINLAKYNAKIRHIGNRIKFFNSDIDNFYYGKYGKYDLIVSNPPYIKLHRINCLEDDIKKYEPKIALNGGVDGFSKIRLVIIKSSTLLKKKGKLVLEVGLNQTRVTLKILKNNGFYPNKICKDLANNNRCIVSTKI